MIDISINKIATLLTGLSVASLSMLHVNVPNAPANGTEIQVRKTIEEFVKAGDNRNLEQMKQVLHAHFRVVANQVMGSTTVNIMTKEQYLALIEEGKLGGDVRTLEILSLEIVNKNASAHVRLKGRALTFDTFYHLVQSEEGHWQLIQDLPFVSKN